MVEYKERLLVDNDPLCNSDVELFSSHPVINREKVTAPVKVFYHPKQSINVVNRILSLVFSSLYYHRE